SVGLSSTSTNKDSSDKRVKLVSPTTVAAVDNLNSLSENNPIKSNTSSKPEANKPGIFRQKSIGLNEYEKQILNDWFNPLKTAISMAEKFNKKVEQERKSSLQVKTKAAVIIQRAYKEFIHKKKAATMTKARVVSPADNMIAKENYSPRKANALMSNNKAKILEVNASKNTANIFDMSYMENSNLL
ncbi:MAG: hypothetical protein VX335_03080, partial [Pseudomonadota bacterium]|nr:hypothetical protein [Pseudomonadota bacterium]